MQDILNSMSFSLRSMKERLFSFPMLPFLFHNSKKWIEYFFSKISDRNETRPFEKQSKFESIACFMRGCANKNVYSWE